MEYSADERETLIRKDEYMDHWIIETNQRPICTKIRKLKGVVILSEEITEKGTVVAGRYKVPLTCVSFRNHRELSAEKRKELSDRAKANFAKEE